ncbi:MAG: hypothetical protein WAN71_24240 [Mycobacterium sp.]|uniref:hypothetical protein n=1 Tax=Mycobacterium sp. TaxID=1785 RepID=UPI003BB0F655
MSNNHRRTVGVVGIAAGALLAPPLIALLASPLASADDIVTIGPFSAGGFTDTLSLNDVTFGVDNYLVSSTPVLDLDLFYGPGTNFGLILTDPGVFQIGYDDIGGTTSFIDSFTPADFISSDFGLSEIAGGAGAAGAEALAGLGL